MSKRVTLADVAREAGVSYKTVSNVVNHSGRMSEVTRARVNEVITRLGYSVNVSARSLKMGSSHLIGLAVNNFLQPFTAYLVTMVVQEAKRRGYGVVVDIYDADMTDLVKDAPSMAADGWILFAAYPVPDKGAMLSWNMPTVLTGDVPSYGKADLVTMPNLEGAYAATKCVLDRGCQRIAVIGAPESVAQLDDETLDDNAVRKCQERVLSSEQGSALRLRGFIRAMNDCGLTPDWRLMRPGGDWTSSFGAAAMASLLAADDMIDAVVCMNDALALGAMSELQKRGRRIPDDVRVIGYDNIKESRYSAPTLSTIDPDIEDYAKNAVAMLLERIGGYAGEARTYVTSYRLIERQSTGGMLIPSD